jgi:hypothetical protein
MNSDPQTFWLTVTNILLGVVVLLAVIAVGVAVVCELCGRLRRRHAAWHEIDDDMRRLFHGRR